MIMLRPGRFVTFAFRIVYMIMLRPIFMRRHETASTP